MYNLGKGGDYPRKRISTIDNIVSAKPDLVLYGIGFREFSNVIRDDIKISYNPKERDVLLPDIQDYPKKGVALLPDIHDIITFVKKWKIILAMFALITMFLIPIGQSLVLNFTGLS